MTTKTYPTVTVGELLDSLRVYPAHYTVDFGGLEFYRLKQRDGTHVQVEFSQPVYLDDAGRVVVDNLE